MTGDTTYPQLIGITLLLYTCSVTGFQEFDTEKCVTNDVWNCSQPKLCVEDVDHQIYPGRIKTLLLNLYIPRGLTQNSSIRIATTADNSVIISDAYLAFQDDTITMTKEKYHPVWVWISGKRVRVSHEAVYNFGDIYCNGSRTFVSTATESPADTESTESPVNTESTESPVNPESMESPVNTESTESPVNTESTESPVNTESTESPINTETTESPVNTESTESPVNTESTESPADRDSTMSPVNTESTESSSFTAELTNGEPSYYCLLQLAVELLMAKITGVPDNSTQTIQASFIWDTREIDVTTILVLKPLQNSSKESNFSTDLLDEVEIPLSSVNTFKLQVLFPNPLSTYTLGLVSSDKRLRIVSVLVRSVGDHYKGIIPTSYSQHPDDELFCSEGPDTRVIDFGYLPNKGAYDSNTSTIGDTVDFEVILLMTEEAIPGETYPLVIYLKVDFVVIQNTTKYFKASERIPMKKLVVHQNQTVSSLPIYGTGSVSLTIKIPPLSSGLYKLTTSTTNNGSGLDGLYVAGVSLNNVGSSYFPCIDKNTHWKTDSSGSLNIANIPYTTGSMSNAKTFTFKISVLAFPESVKALSTYKLTVSLIYPGDGSPQLFEFYFNITEEEIQEEPSVSLYSVCMPFTLSRIFLLTIDTVKDRAYGRWNVEIPVPSDMKRQSFAVCGVSISWKGTNIFGRYDINITKGTDEMIEKALVKISPLANIGLESDPISFSNQLEFEITATLIDTSVSVNRKPLTPFPVRIIRNNRSIWNYSIPYLYEPTIAHFPDFIVLTRLIRMQSTYNHRNSWFHYSRNGSYFYREALEWDKSDEVSWPDSPKIIAYFYFSSIRCGVLCNVQTERLPLKDYITIVNDKNNAILRMVPYVFDQDVDTCFDLPVPGNSFSMFWLRIKQLSLFNVSSNRFVVHITGEGIECARLGQKSVQVGTSRPPYNDQCSMESDIVFCKLVSENTNATLTQCNIECKCDNIQQCLNVHIIMQSTNKDIWRLCEITINDRV